MTYINAVSGLELVPGSVKDIAQRNEMNRQLQKGHIAGQEGYHDNEGPEWVLEEFAFSFRLHESRDFLRELYAADPNLRPENNRN